MTSAPVRWYTVGSDMLASVAPARNPDTAAIKQWAADKDWSLPKPRRRAEFNDAAALGEFVPASAAPDDPLDPSYEEYSDDEMEDEEDDDDEAMGEGEADEGDDDEAAAPRIYAYSPHARMTTFGKSLAQLEAY